MALVCCQILAMFKKTESKAFLRIKILFCKLFILALISKFAICRNLLSFGGRGGNAKI